MSLTPLVCVEHLSSSKDGIVLGLMQKNTWGKQLPDNNSSLPSAAGQDRAPLWNSALPCLLTVSVFKQSRVFQQLGSEWLKYHCTLICGILLNGTVINMASALRTVSFPSGGNRICPFFFLF